MSTSGRGPKTDFKTEQWEDSEFPILCETCLGDNPYVRMSKIKFGGQCKICDKPFTIFRWKPGKQSRYKQTEICQDCAKNKNVCQTCILDLTYGLPVQVRDAFMNGSKALEVNPTAPQGKLQINNDLLRMARKQPYYKRNLPHICSFYARGMCNRGDSCPYRHELPKESDDPLNNQNIVDRFKGKNDPVANKMLHNNQSSDKLKPPENPKYLFIYISIKTIFIGNLDSTITQNDLKDRFYSFGEILSLKIKPRDMCAFIEFSKREDAERAVEEYYNNLEINGKQLVVAWSFTPTTIVS